MAGGRILWERWRVPCQHYHHLLHLLSKHLLHPHDLFLAHQTLLSACQSCVWLLPHWISSYHLHAQSITLSCVCMWIMQVQWKTVCTCLLRLPTLCDCLWKSHCHSHLLPFPPVGVPEGLPLPSSPMDCHSHHLQRDGLSHQHLRGFH